MFGLDGKTQSIFLNEVCFLRFFEKDKGKTHGGVSCEKCKIENFGAECNTRVCFDDYSRNFSMCYDLSKFKADAV